MDFDNLARELIAQAERPLPERLQFFEARCPGIFHQLQTDRGRTGPLPFWGRSLNVDELAGQTIVARSILETLAAAAEVTISLTSPNAGLQHTYGYLFSTIQTPFGKKRDRWIEPLLEDAFGQPPDTFGANPPGGTLLANVTWLAAQIAFRDEPRRMRLQQCLGHRISPTLHSCPWERLRRVRLVETVELTSPVAAQIELVTDVVCAPGIDPRTSTSPNVLVYSVRDSRSPHPALITLFTVSDEFLAALKERATEPRRSDIRPRYNAHIPGFPREPQSGTCRLIDEA